MAQIRKSAKEEKEKQFESSISKKNTAKYNIVLILKPYRQRLSDLGSARYATNKVGHCVYRKLHTHTQTDRKILIWQGLTANNVHREQSRYNVNSSQRKKTTNTIVEEVAIIGKTVK